MARVVVAKSSTAVVAANALRKSIRIKNVGTGTAMLMENAAATATSLSRSPLHTGDACFIDGPQAQDAWYSIHNESGGINAPLLQVDEGF
jgi:hypothetical protein